MAQKQEGILPVVTLSIALYVLRRSMSASDIGPEVTVLLSALKMYTSASERTVNWVTLVLLLVEYFLYSVAVVY